MHVYKQTNRQTDCHECDADRQTDIQRHIQILQADFIERRYRQSLQTDIQKDMQTDSIDIRHTYSQADRQSTTTTPDISKYT